uniref:Uncharacterized protein n=1 Tax=Oryza meridionalis TaxID=40149 RepID=A0A0E0E0F0_9ORYZ
MKLLWRIRRGLSWGGVGAACSGKLGNNNPLLSPWTHLSLVAALVSWLAGNESLGESPAWSLTIADNVDACGRHSLLEGVVALLSFFSGENFVPILGQTLLASRTLFLGSFV